MWGSRGGANTRQQKPFEFDVLADHATAEHQLEHVRQEQVTTHFCIQGWSDVAKREWRAGAPPP
jgi:hypothetical protein